MIVDDVSKAEMLSNYFASVFTVDDGNLPEFNRRVDAWFQQFICETSYVRLSYLTVFGFAYIFSAGVPNFKCVA